MSPPIFILSCGRSGSTLLQRILNSYPDITIWGEHGGFLQEMAAAYFRLRNSVPKWQNVPKGEIRTIEELRDVTRPTDWQAWLNLLTENDIRQAFREHVRSLFWHPAMTEDHYWGFKEIRYGANDRVVEFLAELYPEAIFVFISRNGFNNLASRLKAFGSGGRLARWLPSRGFRDACRWWRKQTAGLAEIHESGDVRSYWFRFEDFSSDLNALSPLLDTLGKSIGDTQHAVLNETQGRGSAFHGDDSIEERWRSMNWLQLATAELILGDVNEALGYRVGKQLRPASVLRRKILRRQRKYGFTEAIVRGSSPPTSVSAGEEATCPAS